MKRAFVLVVIGAALAITLGALSAVWNWSDTVTYSLGGALVALLVSIGLPHALGSPFGPRGRAVRITVEEDSAVRAISSGMDGETSASLVYSPEHEHPDDRDRHIERNRAAGSTVGV